MLTILDGFRYLLSQSQPLLLFLVIGLGFLLGQIRWRGFSLGIAGVLFAGLAFGAWKPAKTEPLVLAPQVMEIGLILFVYAVGLTSGPGFFAALRRRDHKPHVSVAISLVVGAAVALALGRLMHLSKGVIAGTYCGSLTNTPALAAATQVLRMQGDAQATDPTIGYSIAYPFGVLGGLLLFSLFVARNKAAADSERSAAAGAHTGLKHLLARNFLVTNPLVIGQAIGELEVKSRTGLVISRIRHDGDVCVPTKYTRLEQGDVVLAVGTMADIECAEAYFGARSNEQLQTAGGDVTSRRVILSARKLVGLTLDELELDRRFNAQVTRLRRADFDMSPRGDMRLEPGDRLMVVAPTERMGEVAEFFGDSARAAVALDYAALTFGISLGVLVGMMPIPIPAIGSVSLGIAGGPLVVALLLGNLGRTGPLVWSIPYEANETLRHVGLLFFLAGVGVKAGAQLLTALAGQGALIFLLGVICTVVSFLTLFALLRWWAGVGITETLGAASGMHTQPASLAKARELMGSDDVFVAYAMTYPVAMIGKIILAQVLVMLA